MNRRNKVIPVIDLVGETTPRRTTRQSSVIDLTKANEPEIIVLDGGNKNPRKRTRSQTRVRSPSPSPSVVVLGSNFPLRKVRKTTASMTPSIDSYIPIGGGNDTETQPSSTSVQRGRKRKGISQKFNNSGTKNKQSVKKNQASQGKKCNSLGAKQTLKGQRKKKNIKAKVRQKLDMSNTVATNSDEHVNTPEPMSKAAIDYYQFLDKLVDYNQSRKNSGKNKNKRRSVQLRRFQNNAQTDSTPSQSGDAVPRKKTTCRMSTGGCIRPVLRPVVGCQLNQQQGLQPVVTSSSSLFHPQTVNTTVHQQAQPTNSLLRPTSQQVQPTNSLPRPTTRQFKVNRQFRNNRVAKKRNSLRKRLKNDNFNNYYNPDPIDVEKEGYRPVVIDGCNVAMGHGNGRFSARGLQICVDFFHNKGIDHIKVFLPKTKESLFTEDELKDLRSKCTIVFTPSMESFGAVKTSYDDRFIVQYATEVGGVIVTNDYYRDLKKENPTWEITINTRLLMFSWVDDMIMFPKDPLGRTGPTLQEFLKF